MSLASRRTTDVPINRPVLHDQRHSFAATRLSPLVVWTAGADTVGGRRLLRLPCRSDA